jgi:hypothetical protein
MAIIDVATGNLCMWTIFEHPLDAPYAFVARQFIAREGEAIATDRALFGETLDEVRALLTRLYPHLICFARNDSDEPQIVETWL